MLRGTGKKPRSRKMLPVDVRQLFGGAVLQGRHLGHASTRSGPKSQIFCWTQTSSTPSQTLGRHIRAVLIYREFSRVFMGNMGKNIFLSCCVVWILVSQHQVAAFCPGALRLAQGERARSRSLATLYVGPRATAAPPAPAPSQPMAGKGAEDETAWSTYDHEKIGEYFRSHPGDALSRAGKLVGFASSVGTSIAVAALAGKRGAELLEGDVARCISGVLAEAGPTFSKFGQVRCTIPCSPSLLLLARLAHAHRPASSHAHPDRRSPAGPTSSGRHLPASCLPSRMPYHRLTTPRPWKLSARSCCRAMRPTAAAAGAGRSKSSFRASAVNLLPLHPLDR